MANKRRVDIFTAGCLVCDPTIKMVKELACPSCDVHIHDLNKGCETDECREEALKYNLNTIPAMVVDDQVVSCCDNHGSNVEDLRAAGIGVGL